MEFIIIGYDKGSRCMNKLKGLRIVITGASSGLGNKSPLKLLKMVEYQFYLQEERIN